jgi:lipid-binding SYLF domain-containing protein
MIRKCAFILCVLLIAGTLYAANKEQKRLESSTLRPDDDATADVYGRKPTAREIVLGGKVRTPASGRHLVAVLQKNAPRNESKESARK